MGSDGDNILSFLVFGSAIALILCGIYVAKPNMHGTKFERGMCNITAAGLSTPWDDLPTCSCGKGCSEKYPCIDVYGYFIANTSSLANTTSSKPELGTFHKDYKALQKKCVVIPDCSKDFAENEDEVYQYFADNIFDKVRHTFFPSFFNQTLYNYTSSSTFSCWGYDGDMYFDHNYSMMMVYISTIVPATCLLISILLSLCFGSSEQKENILYIVGLPFIVVGAILVGIYTIVVPDDCQCKCNCFKNCCKRETEDPSIRSDLRSVGVLSDDQGSVVSTGTIESRRRNSLILNILGNNRHDDNEPSGQPNRRSSLTFELGDYNSRYNTEPSVPPPPAVDISLSEGIIGGPVYNISSTIGPGAPPPSYDEALMDNVPSTAAPSYEEIMRSSYNK